MFLRGHRLKAVVCLLLCFNLAAAGLVDPLLRLRADTTKDAATKDAPTTATTNPPPTTATPPAETNTNGGDETGGKSSPPTTTSAPTGTATRTSSSMTATTVQPTATLVNGTSILNSTLFNTTVPEGELPLQPVVTPGWGVAGVIMLLTGAVYALIGIKNRFLHTFLSTGFLASLGTTVLIIYVMSPPISNPIQGAFVVAVVCTGLILGGVAIVFKEITEGLGCLLGGFSLSMWLLCLREGGLVQSTGGKIIFIVAFSIGGFAFYFSHYTRHYALIVCIAFGGATVSVLGIDAFSRAGLKEFWAYIWSLNNDIFRLGTVTYPLTKGIRVELAATILIFLAGIVSQLKLWRIVQERRAKRDAARAEDERKLQREEENVGRQIEASNARERREWEAVYGDGSTVPPPPPHSPDEHDSGVGDMESEKRVMRSQATSVSRESRQSGSASTERQAEEAEPIEMTDMRPTPPSKAAAEIVMEQDEKAGAVMVRVAEDEYPEGPPPRASEDAGINAASSRRTSRRASSQNPEQILPKRAGSPTPGPGIVPLPFTIPVGQEDAEETESNHRDNDDRSSVATFADEDEMIPTRPERRRSKLAKRLSQGSADLFRSLSQRSKRASAVLDTSSINNDYGQSHEELISPRSSRLSYHNDAGDNSSIAVTVDGMSDEEDDDENGTVRGGEDAARSPDIEVNAQLTGQETRTEATTPKQQLTPLKTITADNRPVSAATASTDILGFPSSASADTKTVTSDATELAPKTPLDNIDGQFAESKRSSRVAKSTASADSAPVSLTKDRLPRSLSRIAMSYRTNEWAKHLSNADAPEPDNLQLNDVRQPDSPTTPTGREETPSPAAAPAMDDGEKPVPLNVADLQQTAETGAPPPAAPRSASAMSSYEILSRSNSRQSLTGQELASGGRNSATGSRLSTNGYRSMSANQLTSRALALHNEPIAEENDAAELVAAEDDRGYISSPSPDPANFGAADGVASPSPAPFHRASVAPVPGVISYNAPQTLIGQRDMLLRSKSQQGTYIGGPLVASNSRVSLLGGGNVGHMSNAAFPVVPSSGSSDNSGGSVYNYSPGGGLPAAAAGASSSTVDLDDLPMSQRKEIMRQNSLMNLTRPSSVNTGYLGNTNGLNMSMSTPAIASQPAPAAGSVPFDSHQPKRGQAHLPTPAVREAQLATFRNSVAADLRMGAPAVTGAASNPRESMSTPFLNNMASTSSLTPSPYARENEVQQTINTQRSFMMGQKEAEIQRREMERLDKERTDRAFEERMRRGDLLGAHRDAMRRMQASARES